MKVRERYDVIVLGGGLAGLTLALQLRQSKPDVSIAVLEKRSENAPIATHKVGESTSELGSSYLRDVLNLKEYLTEHQLPKFGFRFFFSPEHCDNIARRVEVGSKIMSPYPTHQLDRGLLENELVSRLMDCSVDIVLGAKVSELELCGTGHKVRFEKEDIEYVSTGRWVVDSTGRSGLLKRKLGLEKVMNHDINSAWFRLSLEVDIDDWSDNMIWRNYLDPGRRRLATNHLMGEGYWVWIIPLVSGSTSIGIVADPNYHPFEEYNTFEKAMKWLEKYEPVAAKALGAHKEKRMDFKVMKHFAYDTKQFYSTERWAVTGEAGAFLDPLYSPGTDFIALGNTWLTDLVVRDLNGEDTTLRTMIYELTHKELLGGWLKLYRDMYGLFGKTQIMLMKIVWDWASYWGVPNVLFMNKGYTNIAVLKQFSSSNKSIGRRFGNLNDRMQELFRTWSVHDTKAFADHYFNVFDLRCLLQFQTELNQKHEPEELIQKVQSNLVILEQIAAEIFRMVSLQINGTPEDMRVDPYTMSIGEGKDELLNKSSSQNALDVVESIKEDIAQMWLSPVENQNH